jgi:hypothetical protein
MNAIFLNKNTTGNLIGDIFFFAAFRQDTIFGRVDTGDV